MYRQTDTNTPPIHHPPISVKGLREVCVYFLVAGQFWVYLKEGLYLCISALKFVMWGTGVQCTHCNGTAVHMYTLYSLPVEQQ